MISHCRLPFRFDPLSLAADLDRLSSNRWIRHFIKENYQGEWSGLPLRALDGHAESIHTGARHPDQFQDTAILQNCPYLQKVLATFECPLGAVRLLRLAAGSEIKTHTDAGLGYEFGEFRLHVPIATSPDVDLILDGQPIEMQAGECWYLNFALPHSVVNGGTEDRVHLVIDCIANAWTEELFRKLGFSAIEKYGTRIGLMENHIAGLRQMDTPASKAALQSLLAQMEEIESARRERKCSHASA